MDLGADEWTTFRKVTLPLILPGHPGRRPARVRAVDRRLRDHARSSPASRARSRCGCSARRASACRPRSTSWARSSSLSRSRSSRCRYCGRGGARAEAALSRDVAKRRHLTDSDAVAGQRRDGVAPVWARYTDLVIERGERLVARDDRRRALPRLHVGHRRDQHRPRPSAGRGGYRRAGGDGHPRPAEHRLSQARSGTARATAALLPRRRRRHGRWRADRPVPVELGRRGDRGVGQARQDRHATAAGRRVPRRLPRPHARRDGADQQRRASTRGHFEPLPGGVHFVPFPDPLRVGGGSSGQRRST